MTRDIWRDLNDGILFEGVDIDSALKGDEFMLTLVWKRPKPLGVKRWMLVRDQQPEGPGGKLPVIEVYARKLHAQTWCSLGHVGDDDFDHSWFSTKTARPFFGWLDKVFRELGMCAPFLGSSCHAHAPKLP